ncbi:hypothetical protein KKG82_06215, partial [Patescibacteria group bacterium]|nr:hypothetical protein [Patescibacteria group bacterium]
MSHIEKLQDYLIDKNKGYLIRDISKGKIIMLSGLWGSGKTYFWQEKIANVENIKKNNIYISLYGKKSIEDIENEIISKSILNEFPDNKNLIN